MEETFQRLHGWKLLFFPDLPSHLRNCLLFSYWYTVGHPGLYLPDTSRRSPPAVGVIVQLHDCSRNHWLAIYIVFVFWWFDRLAWTVTQCLIHTVCTSQTRTLRKLGVRIKQGPQDPPPQLRQGAPQGALPQPTFSDIIIGELWEPTWAIYLEHMDFPIVRLRANVAAGLSSANWVRS